MALTKKKTILFVAVFLLLLLIILPVVAHLVANTNAKSNVMEFTENFKSICDIQYSDVSYNIINRHLTVEDISINCNNEKIAYLKTAEFNHIVRGDPLPANMQVEIIDGILYNRASFFKEYGKAVSNIGYDRINFQGTISYTLGKASKEFKIVTLNISAADLGLIQGVVTVSDVYDKDINNIINNIKNKPASFFITFTDNGLKNKIFTKTAEIFGITVEGMRTKTSNAIYKRVQNTKNLPKANYVQLEKFLSSSNSISLKSNPEDNMSLNDILSAFDVTGYKKMLYSFRNLKTEVIAK